MQTTTTKTEKINNEMLKFAKKSLKKLETKTLQKVNLHLKRFSQMTPQEREGFQNDFKEYVVQICIDIKSLIPMLPASSQTKTHEQLKAIVIMFISSV